MLLSAEVRVGVEMEISSCTWSWDRAKVGKQNVELRVGEPTSFSPADPLDCGALSSEGRACEDVKKHVLGVQ